MAARCQAVISAGKAKHGAKKQQGENKEAQIGG